MRRAVGIEVHSRSKTAAKGGERCEIAALTRLTVMISCPTFGARLAPTCIAQSLNSLALQQRALPHSRTPHSRSRLPEQADDRAGSRALKPPYAPALGAPQSTNRRREQCVVWENTCLRF